MSHLPYHTDVSARAAGDALALFAVVDDPTYVSALRRLPDGPWRERQELLRLAASGRAFDRADHLVLSVLMLEWARAFGGSLLEGAAHALAELDVKRLVSIARALKRVDFNAHRGTLEPVFWRVLLALAYRRSLAVETDARALLDLLANEPELPEEPGLELALWLLEGVSMPTASWLSAASSAGRHAWTIPVASPAPPRAARVEAWAEELRSGSADPDDLRARYATRWAEHEAEVEAFVWCAAESAAGWEVGEAERWFAALDALPDAKLRDNTLRDAARRFTPELFAALQWAGLPLLSWTMRFLAAISSDYYGCQQQASLSVLRAALPDLPRAGEDWFFALAALCTQQRDRDARFRLASLAQWVLAAWLRASGRRDLGDEHVTALVAMERTLLPQRDADLLELALARVAGRNGCLEEVIERFGRVQDPWTKGQVLIRQPPALRRDPRLWPMARAMRQVDPDRPFLSLRAFASALPRGAPLLEDLRGFCRVIDACDLKEGLLGDWLIEDLIAAAAAATDRGEALRALSVWVEPYLAATDPRGVQRLVTSLLRFDVGPHEVSGPVRQTVAAWCSGASPAVLAAFRGVRHAAGWGVPAGAGEPAPGPGSPAPPPDRALAEIAAFEAGIDPMPGDPMPDEWVARANLWSLSDEAWVARLAPDAVWRLWGWVREATPSAFAVYLTLQLAAEARARCGARLQGREAPGSSVLEYAFDLGAGLRPLDVDEVSRSLGELSRAVWRYYHEDEQRSEELLRHRHHPALRGHYQTCRHAAQHCGVARPYREVARTGRQTLMWMAVAWFETGRPARMVAGELLHRCARPGETRFVAEWMRRRQAEAT